MAIPEYPKVLPPIRVSSEMVEALDRVDNKSEYVRKAISDALKNDKLLPARKQA